MTNQFLIKAIGKIQRGRVELFWSRVNKTDGCWLWTGSQHPQGYGAINNGKRRLLTHRLSWLLATGEDPGKRLVLHKCNVRLCVRPDHLYLGGHKENLQDRIEAARLKGESFRPHHKLTEEEVRSIKRLLAKKHISQKAIGDKFGVKRSTILSIHLGHSWKTVSL